MESPEEESRDLSDQSAASETPDENEEAVTVAMVGGDEEDPFAFVGESDEEGEDEEEPARPDLLDDVDGPPARRGRKTKRSFKQRRILSFFGTTCTSMESNQSSTDRPQCAATAHYLPHIRATTLQTSSCACSVRKRLKSSASAPSGASSRSFATRV